MKAFKKIKSCNDLLSCLRQTGMWSGQVLILEITSGISNKAFESEESSVQKTNGKTSGLLRLFNV